MVYSLYRILNGCFFLYFIVDDEQIPEELFEDIEKLGEDHDIFRSRGEACGYI